MKCSPSPTPITSGLPSRAATITSGQSRNTIARPYVPRSCASAACTASISGAYWIGRRGRFDRRRPRIELVGDQVAR